MLSSERRRARLALLRQYGAGRGADDHGAAPQAVLAVLDGEHFGGVQVGLGVNMWDVAPPTWPPPTPSCRCSPPPWSER